METKLLDKQSVSAKFAVTIPQADVDKTYSTVLRGLSKQVRVPGFRPGKAPKGVLIQRIGADALAQEVRDFLVETNYPKAVQELELQPVHAHFDAEEPAEGSDYTFEVEVDLYPSVDLPDTSEIIIDSAAEPLTPDLLEASIDQLRNEYATQVPVERPIEEHDVLMVELVPDEEAPADTEPGRMPIDLERTTENLRAQLIGKKMDEEVELTLEAPQGLEAEDEDAPEPTKLKVIIRDIKAKEKPELDDEFAKTLGMETWSEVEQRLRDSVQAQLNSDAFDAQREEFIEKLVAETDFDLPKSIVNRRKLDMLNNLGQDLKKEGLTLEQYISENENYEDKEEFEADLQESAEAAVKRDIVLEQLLEQRGSTVTNEEFEAALRYLASQYGQDVPKFRRERGDTWIENYRFLLTRDKAVREAVRELVGEPEEDEDTKAEAAEEATDDADVPESKPAEPSDDKAEDEAKD